VSAPQIAALNDTLRRALIGRPDLGRVVLTRAAAQLPAPTLAAILHAVRGFSAFTPDNDPWCEHDCARLDVAGERVIWKIDYYADSALDAGSEAPHDPARSYRVLTIMLAADY
jgi:hypothetical protein